MVATRGWRVWIIATFASCAPDNRGESSTLATVSLAAILPSGIEMGAELDPSSRDEVFVEIVDAKLSPDGRFVVALDAAPPYVRVFGSDGSLHAAFVQRGDGPGEARAPVALAVSTVGILLLEPGRIQLLTLAGEVLAQRSDVRVWPMSVTRGCGRGFLIHGPGYQEDGTVAWLWSLDSLNDTLAPVFSDGQTEFRRYNRLSRPLAYSNGVAAFHHDGRDPPETLTLTCPDYGVVRFDTILGLRGENSTAGDRQGVQGVLGLERGRHLLRGIGILRSTPLLAVSVAGKAGTRLVRIGEKGPTAVHTPDAIKIMDAQPDLGVVLARHRPVPHLVRVQYDAFAEAVGIDR